MPFQHEQIELINNSIKSSLNDTRFAGTYWGGIAKDVYRKSEGKESVHPGAIGVDGKEYYYGIDDKYPMIVYHKILTNSYAYAERQFGEQGKHRIVRSNVKMVIASFQNRIRLTANQLEAVISVNFPATVSTTDLNIETRIILDGSDMRQRKVFNEEYQGIEYFLGVEHILFSISYTIETNYKQGCIDICEC